jgi:hypothetical protein
MDFQTPLLNHLTMLLPNLVLWHIMYYVIMVKWLPIMLPMVTSELATQPNIIGRNTINLCKQFWTIVLNFEQNNWWLSKHIENEKDIGDYANLMKMINNWWWWWSQLITFFCNLRTLKNDIICHLHFCSYTFSQSLHLLLVIQCVEVFEIIVARIVEQKI